LTLAAASTWWDVITELVGGGLTVFLTGQYLEEADRLAVRIAVLDAGRVVTERTARELERRVAGPALTSRSQKLGPRPRRAPADHAGDRNDPQPAARHSRGLEPMAGDRLVCRDPGRLDRAKAIAAESESRVTSGSLPSAGRRSASSGLSAIVLDVLVPLALYYVLRGAGASVYLALLLSAIVPGIRTLAGLIATRTVDGLGAFMLTTLLVGVGASLVAGSPRFLLAKEAWVTAFSGAWFLLSARGRRPMAFVFARSLLEGRRVTTGQSWDALLERFHRTFRISSVIWGVGMLVDAALRVLFAYTLPIDVVPALTTVLFPVSFVVIALIDQINYRLTGLRRALLDQARANLGETRA
jgi:hypothetical protein